MLRFTNGSVMVAVLLVATLVGQVNGQLIKKPSDLDPFNKNSGIRKGGEDLNRKLESGLEKVFPPTAKAPPLPPRLPPALWLRNASMGGFVDHVGGRVPGTDRNAAAGDSIQWEFTKVRSDKGDALILQNRKTKMYLDVDVKAGKPYMEAKAAGKGQQWVIGTKDGRKTLMNLHTGTFLFANATGRLGLAREADGECLWEW